MTSLGTHMRASAEAGNVDAQFNLGVMLCNGFDERGRFIGVQRDEALLWLGRAAESGLCRAQCRLGEAYAESGSPADLHEACVWFLIALDNATGPGRQTARAGYEKIERLLSPEQLKSSRAHARTLAAKIRTVLETCESGVNVPADYVKSNLGLRPSRDIRPYWPQALFGRTQSRRKSPIEKFIERTMSGASK